MADFEWTPKKAACALMLAEGYTRAEVAKEQGVGDRTIYNWLAALEFKEEVNRLSLMVGIATRAGRLRIAHKLIRQRVSEDTVNTEKDVLDWLKFAQSETDGAKSELSASLADLVLSMAERGGGTTEGEEGGAQS